MSPGHPDDTRPLRGPRSWSMMDYIMGHNAGALWDQMTAEKD